MLQLGNRFRVCGLVMCLLGSMACAGDCTGAEAALADSTAQSTLVVVIRESDGTPVEFCPVVVESLRIGTMTDASGIGKLKLFPGRWRIQCTCLGNRALSTYYSIAPGAMETLRVVLDPPEREEWRPTPDVSLYVSVRGPTGGPLQGCEVVVDRLALTEHGHQPGRFFTDEEGIARLFWLSRGTWDITCRMKGYKKSRLRVKVAPAADTLTVVLSPSRAGRQPHRLRIE